MARKAIGIDLGGTNIKAGVVDERGQVLSRVSIPTGGEQGFGAVLDHIAQAAHEAREQARVPWARVAAIGLGGPGIFYGPRGVNYNTPNLPALQGKAVRAPLLKRLGRAEFAGSRLVLENDANLAAYAEFWVGCGRKVDTLALFTLGTGVGGGIVLNGRLWRGATGTAAELGHQNLFPDGALCGCGNRGCLEAYASATGLVRRLGEAVSAGRTSVLAGRSRAGEPLSARDITEAARAGDAVARELVEETGRFLGIGVANVLHILNVEMVVFAGGMTAAGKMLLDPIREEAKRRVFPLAFRGVRILFSHMGNDAGLIGAAGWALKESGATP